MKTDLWERIKELENKLVSSRLFHLTHVLWDHYKVSTAELHLVVEDACGVILCGYEHDLDQDYLEPEIFDRDFVLSDYFDPISQASVLAPRLLNVIEEHSQ